MPEEHIDSEEERSINGVDELFNGWIGDKDNSQKIQGIGLTIKQSSPNVIAGEPWSVIGRISNNSQKTIWIVNTKSNLYLPGEVHGRSSGPVGSLFAHFPTIKSTNYDEIVRIDSGSSYVFSWRIIMGNKINNRNDYFFNNNTYDHDNQKDGLFNILSGNIQNSISNYLFFNPGSYTVTSVVHIWTTPPSYNSQGIVTNTGNSFTVAESIEVAIDPSLFVLIIGSILGGTICYILQLIYGKISTGAKFSSYVLLKIITGLFASALFPTVMTILVSRISSTDFILAIKVKDIWGAFATGFVFQWIGHDLLSKLIGKIDDKATVSAAQNVQNSRSKVPIESVPDETNDHDYMRQTGADASQKIKITSD